MPRSLIHYVLLPVLPATLATALSWPAFALRGHVAMVALCVVSLAVGVWQHRTDARRRRQLAALADGLHADDVPASGPTTVAELRDVQEALHEFVARKASAAAAAESSACTTPAPAAAETTPTAETDAAASQLNLESISAALEQMTAIVGETATRAGDASELAHSAESLATKGSSSMKRMVEAMSEIESSSTEISRIIQVIDDIAFQTNLLALNAAVEAARAGDAGKGFAVVAEEVRNLAQRSAEAARNTASLIAAATQRAQRGSELSQEVDGMLGEILDATTRFSSLLTEIATSTREQSQGIQQVTRNVTEMQGSY